MCRVARQVDLLLTVGCACTGDTLEATCHFDSMERDEVTHAGATHHDEMCNLYMMMWSEMPVFMTCSGAGTWHNAPYTDIHGPGTTTHLWEAWLPSEM